MTPERIAELRRWAANAQWGGVDCAMECLDEIERLRSCLEAIKVHQEVICNQHASSTGAWSIADQALRGGKCVDR